MFLHPTLYWRPGAFFSARDTGMDLTNLLKFAVSHGASDIHLQAGASPMVRVHGQMRSVDLPPLARDDARRAVCSLLPPDRAANLEDTLSQGFDFSYAIEGLARFRCNAFSQLGAPGMTIRIIPTAPPDFASLRLPAAVEEAAHEQRGLILIAGSTGSGKSTTLASIIDMLNATYRLKIITIEDPVEYLHVNKKSLISQLEVGRDTPSFAQGLRQALRQDPDTIVIGELRDVDTLRIALRAADTGHQVLSTVHSANAAQTIERIIAMFPPNEHKLLLSQLAKSVEAIIAQRLVTAADNTRLPAVEVLRGTPVAEKFILEGRVGELGDYVARGEAGMQSFDQHLLDLYHAKKISGTQAMRHASNAEAMSLAMRGIRRVGGGAKHVPASSEVLELKGEEIGIV